MISVQPDWQFFIDETASLQSLVDDTNVSVTVTPVWYQYTGVTWSIPATWGNCQFNIYRCEAQEGPYELLNDTPLSGTTFQDNTTRQTSKFIHDYYKVEVIKPDGSTTQSPATTWANTRTTWAQLRAVEIQRREWLLLRKFTGVDSYVFKRKTYGQRCKRCWNATDHIVTDSHCPECYGTGFEGGYFTPVKTLVQYDPLVKNTAYTYVGRLESDEISGWTINYPTIDSEDVILRMKDYKAFVVAPVQNTELQILDVRQILKMTELSKDSIEYALFSQVS